MAISILLLYMFGSRLSGQFESRDLRAVAPVLGPPGLHSLSFFSDTLSDFRSLHVKQNAVDQQVVAVPAAGSPTRSSNLVKANIVAAARWWWWW